MTSPALPPLPAPQRYANPNPYQRMGQDVPSNLFSTVQMRSYGQQCRDEALAASAKALEFGGYMAKEAERLIDAVNDLALADQEYDAGIANKSDVGAAREAVSEASAHLRNGIYEFRKRALKTTPPHQSPTKETP